MNRTITAATARTRLLSDQDGNGTTSHPILRSVPYYLCTFGLLLAGCANRLSAANEDVKHCTEINAVANTTSGQQEGDTSKACLLGSLPCLFGRPEPCPDACTDDCNVENAWLSGTVAVGFGLLASACFFVMKGLNKPEEAPEEAAVESSGADHTGMNMA